MRVTSNDGQIIEIPICVDGVFLKPPVQASGEINCVSSDMSTAVTHYQFNAVLGFVPAYKGAGFMPCNATSGPMRTKDLWKTQVGITRQLTGFRVTRRQVLVRSSRCTKSNMPLRDPNLTWTGVNLLLLFALMEANSPTR